MLRDFLGLLKKTEEVKVLDEISRGFLIGVSVGVFSNLLKDIHV